MIEADAKADAGNIQHWCEQAPEDTTCQDALHVKVVSSGASMLLPSRAIKHLQDERVQAQAAIDWTF